MRTICYKCLRPIETCLCKFLPPFDSGVKFVFLMHPKEAKRNRTGTGRIAHAGLLDSEILVGIDFTKHARLCELLADERYYPVLLYPGEDAWNAQKEGFKSQIGKKKLLAIIIDSTWFCSKKMIRLSTNIMALPKLSFAKSYRSIYTFKKEPSEECVSTIETCYYLIKELQEAEIVDGSVNPECLMTAFKELIKFQLQKENDRIDGKLPNSHATDYKYTKKKEIPDFISD
ncbi:MULTISPECIES: tRNA-uridine aminocarboxypropyltransferase [unclassified Treponema]|uniref:tRNA-uridine aminocarboxypropyltransferase n=1 Tax=unclassified Treponema TaxID=2638727 RepID=UPI0025DE4D45|nr:MULTISPECIES: tRNA-uridine aminocarboxypropyltransferase [unclassified Treponema]MBQ8678543.1 DTW domain-containing protein [Treponema sp.]